MKAHEYWSVGALITMLGTFYSGYKGSKSSHKYFAASSLLCMIMAIYTGHKMISKNKKTKKEPISLGHEEYYNQLCAHWARSWHSHYGVRRNPDIFFYVFLHLKKIIYKNF